VYFIFASDTDSNHTHFPDFANIHFFLHFCEKDSNLIVDFGTFGVVLTKEGTFSKRLEQTVVEYGSGMLQGTVTRSIFTPALY